MSELLRIANLNRDFRGVRALNNVSLSLDAGERLAVLGPSGSGKTTLIRLIAGLEAPDDGDISIAGTAVSRAGEIVVRPELRGVALVFQGLALFPHLNALDQIAFAARGRGGVAQARTLLEQIGLGHRAKAQLDELSGGERQRVALARALAQEPKLLLMDEPFASLDDQKRSEMREMLRSLLDSRQTTLILVTHSRDDALDLARRVLVLEAGRDVANDLLETVVARPCHVAAARALGLGQIILGEMTAPGTAQTPFGAVSTDAQAGHGSVRLLIRPGQPRFVHDGSGVEARVIAVELRPSESRQPCRIVVVRVADHLLRVAARESSPGIGDPVRVRIDEPCEVLKA